jgi:universal stress protein E
MAKLRRSLVPIKDPGKRTQPAALKAVQLARGSGAAIELFHTYDALVDVYALTGTFDIAAFERQEHAKILRRLDKLAVRLRKLGPRVTTAVETDYPAHEAIIRRATRVGADLVVLDAHGHHRAPALLRVTDWELLRHSPVPILLVKNGRPYRRPAIVAAVDPQHSFSKPSGLDAVILDEGATLERALGGRLHAMHSYVPYPATAMSAGRYSTGLVDPLRLLAESQAKAGMDRLLRHTGISASRRHLVPRHPLDAIPQIARDTQAGIVVMGAVSRSGLKRIFIGNTAERVFDELGCDVLVVKPKSFDPRIPKQTRGINWRLIGGGTML